MGALTHNGEVMQGLPADASQINFDKTGTDLNSTQTENAIKEVNAKVNTNTADINQLKSGLTNVNDWGLLDTFDTAYAVTADYLELLFCECNESGGTYWATEVVPARNIPSVMIVGSITISRSGNTFTIIANPNSHYIRLFKR